MSRILKQAVFGIVVLACRTAFSGWFIDDFNRGNTAPTTDGGVIWTNWNISGNEFSINQQRLRFEGATADNFIFNTDAVTTSGDFILKVDLIHNHAANSFNNNIGAVWQMGAHEGGVAVDDGFALRLGDDTYQLLRMKNGVLASLGTGSFSQIQQGVAYTLTVTATGNRAWDFSIDRASDGINFASFSGQDTSDSSGSGDWADADGYGGVWYNNNVSGSWADNFLVESPAATGGPFSAYGKWGIANGLSPGVNDDPADNPDASGGSRLDNLAEYALDGDPLDALSEGLEPVHSMVEEGGTNRMQYIYPKRSDPESGLAYYLELTEDLLVPDSWSNAGYSVVGEGPIDEDFNAVTNDIPAGLPARFVRLSVAALWTGTTYEDYVHLDSGSIGSVWSDFYYETNAPYGDEVVWGWDLISEPTVPISGPWGNKTGLFVPAPYGDYGLGRHAAQPTTYIQVYSNEVGICLDVQPGEVGSQTYNPNVKSFYFWDWGSYGKQGSAGWLYPFHSTYSNTNPRLLCTFDAAVVTSSGTGVRHANTSFQWVDEVSGEQLYVQHYVYDSRTSINAVSSGYDPKINKLWIAQKLGDPAVYCGTLEGSGVFTNAVWADYTFFGVDTSWGQFEDMVVFLNGQHGTSFGTDRDKWRLASASFNLEMQQGHEGSVGGKVKDMKVWTRDE